eukprot:TRINITY_DN33954_c0_g1_i1.p1 TRINITY_DN33954_c0_g1~~TRINITY_DN33954_c0_g1_i1.p1  ORF type:complete len:316 (-),score=82.47 TRINITY_DN33954_c0_g1_i1:163-1110(-)
MPTRDMYPNGLQKALTEAPKVVDRKAAYTTVRDLLDYTGPIDAQGKKRSSSKVDNLERDLIAKNLADGHDTPPMAMAAEDLVVLAMSQKCLSLPEVRRNAFGSLTCITMNPSAVMTGGSLASASRAATPAELKAAGFVDDNQAKILELQTKLRKKSGRMPEHIIAKLKKELEGLQRIAGQSSTPAPVASPGSKSHGYGTAPVQTDRATGRYLFAVKTLDPVTEVKPNFSYVTNHKVGNHLRFSSLFQHQDMDMDVALLNDAEMVQHSKEHAAGTTQKRCVAIPEPAAQPTYVSYKKNNNYHAGGKRPRHGDSYDK